MEGECRDMKIERNDDKWERKKNESEDGKVEGRNKENWIYIRNEKIDKKEVEGKKRKEYEREREIMDWRFRNRYWWVIKIGGLCWKKWKNEN